jgi:hypothetical protein
VTCKKAIGVAEEIKKEFGKNLELKIYTTDSEEAKPYNFGTSTNVLFQKELIPIDIATDPEKMKVFLFPKV